MDETKELLPEPEAWPVCSEDGTPYVYRRVLLFGRGHVWLWQPDTAEGCKHPRSSKAEPVLHNADGAVPSE